MTSVERGFRRKGKIFPVTGQLAVIVVCLHSDTVYKLGTHIIVRKMDLQWPLAGIY